MKTLLELAAGLVLVAAWLLVAVRADEGMKAPAETPTLAAEATVRTALSAARVDAVPATVAR